MIARTLLAATAALAFAAPAAAQDFAITNATVATGDGSAPIENATVVVQAGAASSAALNGELRAEVSLLSPTAPTSHRPSAVTVANRPGVTHAPVPSDTGTPANPSRASCCSAEWVFSSPQKSDEDVRRSV